MMPYTTDRVELKLRAKDAMKKAAPNIFLVAFVCLLLTNAPTFVTEGPTIRLMLKADSLEEMMYIYENGGVSGGFLLSLATLAMSIFLNLVTCGWQLYTLRASREEETGGLETLFACFQQFWRFFSAILLMGLFTALWTMLFVIPGIVAIYAYSQTIYIMLDHPEMSAMEAIAASKQMMRGHKAELLVLELSFIGWAIVAGFTFGILLIWLEPYMQVSRANFYNAVSNWQPYVAPEPDVTAAPEEWWKQ